MMRRLAGILTEGKAQQVIGRLLVHIMQAAGMQFHFPTKKYEMCRYAYYA